MSPQASIKDRRMRTRPESPQPPKNLTCFQQKQEVDRLEMQLRAIYQAARQTRSL